MFRKFHIKLDELQSVLMKVASMCDRLLRREEVTLEDLSIETLRRTLDLAGPDLDLVEAKDPLVRLGESERRGVEQEIRSAFGRWLKKDLEYFIAVQTRFSATQTQSWEQNMFARGAISAYGVLLERYKGLASRDLQGEQDKQDGQSGRSKASTIR